MGIARKQIRWNGWGWAAHQDQLAGCEALWRWLAGELGMPALLATPARPLEDVTLSAPGLTAEQIAAFTAILGPDRVAREDHERAFHARGRGYRDLLALRMGDLSNAPDAVLYPRGEDEVLALLQLAVREKIAVIPFGGGTGQAGGVSAGPGSVTIDLSGMDQLLEVDAQARTAVAEAGIYGPALEKALATKGFMLDEQRRDFEFSSLGGWIASSRGADWLMGVRLATPQGLLNTNAGTGPDLKHLVLGSQGGFGIITRAKIKLRHLATPIARAFLFRDLTGGSAAMREALQANIAHILLHLSDAEENRFQRAFAELENPRGLLARLKDAWAASRHFDSGATLLIGNFADEASARQFEILARRQGCMMLGEAPARRWLEGRFQALYMRDAMLDRGVGMDEVECRASWSALPALHAAVRAALDRAMQDNAPRPGAHGLVLSHIENASADGATLAFTILFPRQLENELAQAQAIRRAGFTAMLAHGGAPIGDNDQNAKAELGLAALRGLKSALDPEGIMNPGKLL